MSDDFIRKASLENKIENTRTIIQGTRDTLATQQINLALAQRTGVQSEIDKWTQLVQGTEGALAREESELSGYRSELQALTNPGAAQPSPTQAGAASTTGGDRNVGAAGQERKPDGTPVDENAGDPSMPTGSVDTDEGEEPGAAVEVKDGEIAEQKSDPNSTYVSPRTKLPNLVPNPLEQFASYSALWTMAVLTPEQFNNPSSYRTEDLSFGVDFDMDFQTGEIISEKQIIFSSGGRGDEFRTNTLYGAPEYFVDNFSMRATVSANHKSGNSNAVGFKFEIYEPYSMGLFLQSMQNAAIKAGYANYLDNAPYVLRLDIKGWSDEGTQVSTVKPKFFVMKLSKVDFTTDESGSKYNVEAIPYNHAGFGDTINTLFTEVAIEPDKEGTLEELLVTGRQSLCSLLNRNEERLKSEGRIGVPDQYVVQFPNKSSDFARAGSPNDPGSASRPTNSVAGKSVAGTNAQVITSFDSNPIGKSKFGFDQGSGGNYGFKREQDVYDPATGRILRDKMSIDPKKRTFHFTQKQSITDILTQCVLATEYAFKAIDPNNMQDGFIKWFKLDVQIEFLQFDALVGDYARKITFRVVPFLVHHSVFSNPNSPSIGMNKLRKKIVKSYEYIYTGQNSDILNFNIKINNLFFTGANSSPEANTAAVQNKNQAGIAETPGKKTPLNVGPSPENQTAKLGTARVRPEPRKTGYFGGSGTKTTEQKVAEAFHKAFIEGSSMDLVTLDMEILGDTYWLIDSGFANHFSPPSDTSDLITQDGTANYEGSDVYILITFRTPADVNTNTGLYEFATKGKESPFSGVYRVTLIENIYSEGVFKQKLSCLRIRGQSGDFDGEVLTTDKQSATMVAPKESETPKTDLIPGETIAGTIDR